VKHKHGASIDPPNSLSYELRNPNLNSGDIFVVFVLQDTHTHTHTHQWKNKLLQFKSAAQFSQTFPNLQPVECSRSDASSRARGGGDGVRRGIATGARRIAWAINSSWFTVRAAWARRHISSRESGEEVGEMQRGINPERRAGPRCALLNCALMNSPLISIRAGADHSGLSVSH